VREVGFLRSLSRSLYELLSEANNLVSDQERVEALRSMPKVVRVFLRWALSDTPLDLLDGPLEVRSIPTAAFARDMEAMNADYDQDLLAKEAFSLTRLFSKGGHPHLTAARRLDLWESILERLTKDERELMEDIRIHRTFVPFPRLTRAIVDAAWPGILQEKPPPLERPEEPSYLSNSRLEARVSPPVEQRPLPPNVQLVSEDERNYRDMMARLGFAGPI
jgi:hypothetical protein